jgi:predicted RNase H-like HicB family nuclease
MKYAVRLNPARDGGYIAVAVTFPNCYSRAATREEALSKIREEIRYRIELCPCTGVSDDFVEVEMIL